MYYFLQDHLGSTRVITNSSGSVVRDADYYPHGTEKLVSGTVDDPHKFAGMYLDSETGLYYTWFRMYSPSLGRWLTPDPIAGDVENPGSLNRYAYVQNNPVNFVDPLGLILGAPPSWPPGPDPFGPPAPNPFGNGEGCTAPDGQCGGRPPGTGGGTVGKGPVDPKAEDVKDAVYELFEDDINRCIGLVFGPDAARIPLQTRKNAPNLNLRLNNQQVGRLSGVPVAWGSSRPFSGPNGTIYISGDLVNLRTPTTALAVYGTYIHELGNILDIRLNPTTYDTYGRNYGHAPHHSQTDTDTGHALEECVFFGTTPSPW